MRPTWISAPSNSESLAETPQPESSGGGGGLGLVMGIVGGLLVLGGIGLAIYALRLRS